MDLTTLENENFASYNDHCEMCAVGSALPDGCPDPSRYLASDFKVLFVLKEAHWKDDAKSDYPRDLRKYALDGGRYKTWGNLALWCSLMRNPAFASADLDICDGAGRAEALGSGCFVNLKKIPGKSRSESDEIAAFAKAHSDLLRAQFALYKPDVTITCGTYQALKGVYNDVERLAEERPLRDFGCGFAFSKQAQLGTVIDFYHPQYIGRTPKPLFEMLRLNLHHFPERFGEAV